MYRFMSYFKAGLFVVAISLCVTGCANKKKGDSGTREIWENRTEQYLDRMLTEANLQLNEATEQLGVVNGRETVDSASVERAEEKVQEARRNARIILGYMRILETPAEERTKEEGETLEKVYNACRKIENDGWGYQVSERLVEYMESATPELQP